MVINKTCKQSVSKVVEMLKAQLAEKQIKVFDVIDHAKEARDAHLELRDEMLVIFGNPKVGTFLMQEKQSIGLDLPLKILVWEDEKHTTNISYQDPVEIGKAHGIEKHQDILLKLKGSIEELVDFISNK